MHFIIILSQIKYYEAKLLWTLKQENLLLKSKPVRKYIPDKLDKKSHFYIILPSSKLCQKYQTKYFCRLKMYTISLKIHQELALNL